MKIYFKAFATALLLLGLNKSTFAQGYDVSSDYQNIVTPTTIVKTIDINFSEAEPETLPCSVTITPSGDYKVSSCGNGKVASTSSASAASFALTDKPDYIYAITLPSSGIIINENANCYIADKFTSSPRGIGILNSSGIQVIKIGATFKMHTCHTSGNTTNTNAPVIVNYN